VTHENQSQTTSFLNSLQLFLNPIKNKGRLQIVNPTEDQTAAPPFSPPNYCMEDNERHLELFAESTATVSHSKHHSKAFDQNMYADAKKWKMTFQLD
jgi:hypothetical protein